MTHPNEDLIRKLYQAAGDAAMIKALFSPNIVWHEPGRSPVSGNYKGIEAFMGFFSKTFELSGGTFKLACTMSWQTMIMGWG